MKTRLMTHLVAGYPNFDNNFELIETMVGCGTEFIEIQIPFSDPVADGQTIMNANVEALKSGITVESVFDFTEKVSAKFADKTKLLFMTYFNIIFNYGLEAFVKKAAEMNLYGFIVPDLPFDSKEGRAMLKLAKKHGLIIVPVLSPLITENRLSELAEISGDCELVYCPARLGITGTKTHINSNLKNYLERVRSYFKGDLAVGFGISSKEDVQLVCEYADVAVIGSHILRLNQAEGAFAVRDFLLKL
jgi:tryptophan synthase alpha chain